MNGNKMKAKIISKIPRRPPDKPWTFEYVAALFTDGGFRTIADMHNREMKERNGATDLIAI
jgi:hypothetical protein